MLGEGDHVCELLGRLITPPPFLILWEVVTPAEMAPRRPHRSSPRTASSSVGQMVAVVNEVHILPRTIRPRVVDRPFGHQPGTPAEVRLMVVVVNSIHILPRTIRPEHHLLSTTTPVPVGRLPTTTPRRCRGGRS